MDRAEAIKAIRHGLRKRSGRSWSVVGGRGTAYGWITIDAFPSRHVDGHMTPEDRKELAELLGLESVHSQGVSIPASNDYRIEYVDRANGRTPSKIGEPYWD